MSSSRYISPGTIIEQRPNLKAFPLADLLSLASGLMLPQAGARAVHALVGYICEKDDIDAAAAGALAKDAKACLEAQLPFLKDIDYGLLYTAFKSDRAHMEDHLQMWLEVQMKKYGAEHYVMPLSRWEKRRNSHKL